MIIFNSPPSHQTRMRPIIVIWRDLVQHRSSPPRPESSFGPLQSLHSPHPHQLLLHPRSRRTSALGLICNTHNILWPNSRTAPFLSLKKFVDIFSKHQKLIFNLIFSINGLSWGQIYEIWVMISWWYLKFNFSGNLYLSFIY